MPSTLQNALKARGFRLKASSRVLFFAQNIIFRATLQDFSCLLPASNCFVSSTSSERLCNCFRLAHGTGDVEILIALRIMPIKGSSRAILLTQSWCMLPLKQDFWLNHVHAFSRARGLTYPWSVLCLFSLNGDLRWNMLGCSERGRWWMIWRPTPGMKRFVVSCIVSLVCEINSPNQPNHPTTQLFNYHAWNICITYLCRSCASKVKTYWCLELAFII